MEQMTEKLDGMPESIVTQGAIRYLKNEYHIVDWMSGRHYAAEDKRDTAVTHLAVARRQKKGNGTPGL